jgi:hypothetical protein
LNTSLNCSEAATADKVSSVTEESMHIKWLSMTKMFPGIVPKVELAMAPIKPGHPVNTQGPK